MEFGDAVAVVDGGPSRVGVESTIVDTTNERPAILRLGGVLPDDISALVGPLGASSTVAPGTLKSHYAPLTSLQLSTDPERDKERLEALGLTVAVFAAPAVDVHARTLYAELRRLDGLGVDVLIAERAQDGGLGAAINDRLTRAAHPFSTSDG